MWTSQVYGHHDKMARTKAHRVKLARKFLISATLKRLFNIVLLHGNESKSISEKSPLSLSTFWFNFTKCS